MSNEVKKKKLGRLLVLKPRDEVTSSQSGTKITPFHPGRYCRIPLSVLTDHEVSLLGRCAYGMLSVTVFGGNLSRTGIRRISTALGVRQSAVKEALRELEVAGHIKCSESKRGFASRYELLSPVFRSKGRLVSLRSA